MEFDSSSDEGEIDDDSYHSSDDEPIIKQQASKPVIPPLPSFPLFNCNPNKKRRTDSTEITESTSTLFTSNNRNTHNKNKKKQSPPQVITKKKNKKNNKELCHAQHIYDTWDIMAKKEKESVMDDIHEFTERLGCELDKRFKDSDDSMKLGYH
eukprot:928098_1